MTRSLTVAVVASLLLLMHAQPAAAADSPVGSWVKKTEAGKPAMTLEIEQWSPGKAKLTWHIPKANMELTLVTALDASARPAVAWVRCWRRIARSSTSIARENHSPSAAPRDTATIRPAARANAGR